MPPRNECAWSLVDAPIAADTASLDPGSDLTSVREELPMTMEQELAGRVALVTGAASGMGLVMARALAAAGAKLAAVDIDRAGLDRMRGETGFSGRCLAVTADVSQSDDAERAVRQVLAELGRLDVLINCAGISMSSAAAHKAGRITFFEADPGGWQRILAVNCIGAFLMARFAAVAMIERGWGRIINVTTSFDTMLAAGLSAYGASKAALEACCVSFAKDLEGTGVTVNVLVPGGPTDTAGFFPPGKPRPSVLLDPEIMGPPVVWLASPQSDGITGSRFIARDWDASLPAAEAAGRVRASAAWPDLARAASADRGYAM
jgi:NAD(P)-dependent dehydrogenase (short-subunit alcohol dehydrogenase family)